MLDHVRDLGLELLVAAKAEAGRVIDGEVSAVRVLDAEDDGCGRHLVAAARDEVGAPLKLRTQARDRDVIRLEGILVRVDGGEICGAGERSRHIACECVHSLRKRQKGSVRVGSFVIWMMSGRRVPMVDSTMLNWKPSRPSMNVDLPSLCMPTTTSSGISMRMFGKLAEECKGASANGPARTRERCSEDR